MDADIQSTHGSPEIPPALRLHYRRECDFDCTFCWEEESEAPTADFEVGGESGGA